MQLPRADVAFLIHTLEGIFWIDNVPRVQPNHRRIVAPPMCQVVTIVSSLTVTGRTGRAIGLSFFCRAYAVSARSDRYVTGYNTAIPVSLYALCAEHPSPNFADRMIPVVYHPPSAPGQAGRILLPLLYGPPFATSDTTQDPHGSVAPRSQ